MSNPKWVAVYRHRRTKEVRCSRPHGSRAAMMRNSWDMWVWRVLYVVKVHMK